MATADGADRLDAALRRALTQRARLTATVRMTVPDLPPELTDRFPPDNVMTGEVDFIADRCALNGPGGQVLMSGANTYSPLDDGRWTVSSGPDGSWGVHHPHGLLAGLRSARTDLSVNDEQRYVVELDVHTLAELINPGISPSWQPRGEAVLNDAGILVSASLILTDREGRMETRFDFAWTEEPLEIVVPAAELTITLREHLEELHGGPLELPDEN